MGLREAARAALSGRNAVVSNDMLEPPEFGRKQAPSQLGLAVGIDEGPIVVTDSGIGAEAAGPGIARAEAMAGAQARAGEEGLVVCAEAAAAPEAAGMWPDDGEEVELSLEQQGEPIPVVRYR